MTAFKVLGFPRTKVADVKRVMDLNDEVQFKIDERIEEHLEVECQYDHYTKQ